MVTIIILSTMKFITCVKNKKKIFKSAQVCFQGKRTWRVQSLLNDDGIFFTLMITSIRGVVLIIITLLSKISIFGQQVTVQELCTCQTK